MADLDEISMMLGEIRADVRHALKWFDEHEERDQERFEKLTARIDANNGYRFRIEALEDTIEIHKPVFNQVVRLKWIVAGFVAALGLIGGAVGSWASDIMKWIV